MKILIASNNPGKIREIKSILADLPIQFFSVNEAQEKFGQILPQDIEESATTLEGNAELKARQYAELSGLPCLADDSGLELVAEPGFPGVHSNRWFSGTDEERCLALLARMQNYQNRKATFQTVLCFYEPKNQQSHFFSAMIYGQIAKEILPGEGFGYDSVFIPDGFSESYAQLGPKKKNEISQRQQALQKFRKYIENIGKSI